MAWCFNGLFKRILALTLTLKLNIFSQQAIEAADIVAQGHNLHGNYASLFNSIDLSGIDEILLWRKYSVNSDATSYHFVVAICNAMAGETQAIHVPWLILI